MILKNVTTHLPFLYEDIILEKSYQNDLIQEVKKSKDSRQLKKGVYGKMSSFDLIREKPIFTKLYLKISKTIEDFYPLDHIIDREESNYTTRISDIWFVEYKKNEKSLAHTHNAEISFCYYLKSDKDSSAILFPRNDLKIKPYSGLLIVFPGLLQHKTETQKGDTSRIVIAGNANVFSTKKIGI
jgi:hypothetical protein